MNNPLQEFKGYIEKDKFEFDTPKEEIRFKTYMTSIKNKKKEKTPIKIIVKKFRSGRTSGQAHEKSNQNGYYFGTIIQTLINSEPFIGHTPEDMDRGLRCMFLRTGGTDAFPRTESFADLNTGEFEEKMKLIQIWALTDYQIKIETVEEYYHGTNYEVKRQL